MTTEMMLTPGRNTQTPGTTQRSADGPTPGIWAVESITTLVPSSIFPGVCPRDDVNPTTYGFQTLAEMKEAARAALELGPDDDVFITRVVDSDGTAGLLFSGPFPAKRN